ncbi:hypothetical protein AVEN_222656-1 [Araneus ventricosus]|uniref:Uncharacterized protein n=1 Tax=Araneus ventricosus TaxID=182803 RepID=A0A4Y2PUA1_ARAVE|nr:hypothetical protein AVEN_222656-1 [Araneus ventricosus]
MFALCFCNEIVMTNLLQVRRVVTSKLELTCRKLVSHLHFCRVNLAASLQICSARLLQVCCKLKLLFGIQFECLVLCIVNRWRQQKFLQKEFLELARVTINSNQSQKLLLDVTVAVFGAITVWDSYRDYSFFKYNYRDSINQREKRILAPLSSDEASNYKSDVIIRERISQQEGLFTVRRLKPRWVWEVRTVI